MRMGWDGRSLGIHCFTTLAAGLPACSQAPAPSDRGARMLLANVKSHPKQHDELHLVYVGECTLRVQRREPKRATSPHPLFPSH